jgi:ADP-ribosylglycohydrolase
MLAVSAIFRPVVLTAANLGGDPDTTAAILGQLAGAVYRYAEYRAVTGEAGVAESNTGH